MNQPGFHGFSLWPGGLSRQLGRSTGFAGRPLTLENAGVLGKFILPCFLRLQEGKNPKIVRL